MQAAPQTGAKRLAHWYRLFTPSLKPSHSFSFILLKLTIYKNLEEMIAN